MKIAVEGPAQGTNMGSMHARKTSSSVNGATTWFLSQRMSLRHSVQKQGSTATFIPSINPQGQSMVSWIRGPRNSTMVRSSGRMTAGTSPSNRIPIRASNEGPGWMPVKSFHAHTNTGDRADTISTLVKRLFITAG